MLHVYFWARKLFLGQNGTLPLVKLSKQSRDLKLAPSALLD